MERCNLIRADHLDNIKRGGVRLYFKKSLALKKIELSHISKCLLCEVNIKGQVGFIIVSCCSPSQTSSQFDDFYQILRTSLMMLRSFSQPLHSS